MDSNRLSKTQRLPFKWLWHVFQIKEGWKSAHDLGYFKVVSQLVDQVNAFKETEDVLVSIEWRIKRSFRQWIVKQGQSAASHITAVVQFKQDMLIDIYWYHNAEHLHKLLETPSIPDRKGGNIYASPLGKRQRLARRLSALPRPSRRRFLWRFLSFLWSGRIFAATRYTAQHGRQFLVTFSTVTNGPFQRPRIVRWYSLPEFSTHLLDQFLPRRTAVREAEKTSIQRTDVLLLLKVFKGRDLIQIKIVSAATASRALRDDNVIVIRRR
mgnify:CR=1 FL=1